jgi:hypothetical protein
MNFISHIIALEAAKHFQYLQTDGQRISVINDTVSSPISNNVLHAEKEKGQINEHNFDFNCNTVYCGRSVNFGLSTNAYYCFNV